MVNLKKSQCLAVAAILTVGLGLGLIWQRTMGKVSLVTPEQGKSEGASVKLEITAEQAQSLAIKVTGFKNIGRLVKTALVPAKNLHLPFLGKRLEGRLAWEVVFGDVRLKLPSAPAEYKDNYTRQFRVVLDAQNGQLFCINSLLSGATSDEATMMPDDDYANEQMRYNEAFYVGLPPGQPTVTFVDALDTAMRSGDSPYEAREIHAVSVMQQVGEHNPRARAIWAITLSGIPLILSVSHPEVEPEAGDHIRIIIGASDGKCYYSTNLPQHERPEVFEQREKLRRENQAKRAQ